MNRAFAVTEAREPVGHRLTRHQSGLAGRFVQRQPRGEPGCQGR